MTKLVFLDTETTGLADHCEVWEIGLIVRVSAPDDVDSPEGLTWIDIEYCWQIRPDLTTAEPTGLRIGRYYDRLQPVLRTWAPGHGRQTHPERDEAGDIHSIRSSTQIAGDLARLLDGATIVGAVPDFDARHLTQFLRDNGQAGTWHYHLVDVETFAAGSLGLAPPWGFDDLLATYQLKYDEADRHTALGDARMVRDLYDAVLTPPL